MIGTWLSRARPLAAACSLNALVACVAASPSNPVPVDHETSSAGGLAGAPGAGGEGGLVVSPAGGAAGSSSNAGSATTSSGSAGAPRCADSPMGERGSSAGAAGASGAAFEAREGLDAGMLAREVGEEFRVSVRRLRANASGETWVLWESFSDPDALTGTPHLDHFDASGRWVAHSVIEAERPIDFVRHETGALTAWRHQCGEDNRGTCFYREFPSGKVSEEAWPLEPQQLTRYRLDEEGNVVGEEQAESSARVVLGASDDNEGLSVVTRESRAMLYRLRSDFSSRGSVELLPAVVGPAPASDAPLEDILRLLPLTQQSLTAPFRTSDAVIVAAAITSPSFVALEMARGLELMHPTDPRCADIVVIRVPDDGSDLDYFVIPTELCESHPLLTVVDDRAVVASLVWVSHSGGSNDTEHYDISVGIVDLTGQAPLVTRTLGWEEDDWARALVPCGVNHVCMAGMKGARSVDTGSVVSYGNGFIQRLSLMGNPAGHWTVTSPRHTNVWQLAGASACSLRFFATANGPITHTADSDPSLAFNEGWLGALTLPNAP